MMPQYSVSELEQIFILARKYGVTQILVKGLEVHFVHNLPVSMPGPKWEVSTVPLSHSEPIRSEGLPTEDDLLNWSNGLPLPSEVEQAEKVE